VEAGRTGGNSGRGRVAATAARAGAAASAHALECSLLYSTITRCSEELPSRQPWGQAAVT
jgi:hypothetical protein